jgi:hypothetical protein
LAEARTQLSDRKVVDRAKGLLMQRHQITEPGAYTHIRKAAMGKGSGFLRGDSAVQVGTNRGLALPCATPGRSQFVLAQLSALGTPIARRLEIWRPDADSDALALAGGFCETRGLLDKAGLRVQRGQGSVGRCWLTGLPGTSTHLAGEPGEVGSLPGIKALAVLPVLADGRFVAAVALYF